MKSCSSSLTRLRHSVTLPVIIFSCSHSLVISWQSWDTRFRAIVVPVHVCPVIHMYTHTRTLLKHIHTQPHILSEYIPVEVQAVHSATAEDFSRLLSCHCTVRPTHTHTLAHSHTHTSPPPQLCQPERRSFRRSTHSFTFHTVFTDRYRKTLKTRTINQKIHKKTLQWLPKTEIVWTDNNCYFIILIIVHYHHSHV